MNKFDRIISLLILLQTKKTIKASLIAERFNTSLRTVYRDINSLKNAGIPIIGEPGIGYSIMAGYRLPPVMFDEGEAISMLTAEKLMTTFSDVETQEHFTKAMNKIKAILRSSEKQTLAILDHSISVKSFRKEEHKPYLHILFQCIASLNLIKLVYKKKDGSSSERIVEPIACYHQSNKWYLVAYCQIKNDYRTFKMNQIQNLNVLDQTFSKHQFNLEHYLEEQWTALNQGQDAQVVELEFEKSIIEHANRRKYYFGLIEEIEGEHSVKMKFWAVSIELFARWLMPFTNKVRVIKPVILHERLKELSTELFQYYHPKL